MGSGKHQEFFCPFTFIVFKDKLEATPRNVRYLDHSYLNHLTLILICFPFYNLYKSGNVEFYYDLLCYLDADLK